MNHSITYGLLHKLLRELQFEDVPTQPKWRAFRHPDTGMVVLLTARDENLPARAPDVLSIRRHLDSHGILDAQQFEQYFGDVA